jgi:hypothetical protein
MQPGYVRTCSTEEDEDEQKNTTWNEEGEEEYYGESEQLSDSINKLIEKNVKFLKAVIWILEILK